MPRLSDKQRAEFVQLRDQGLFILDHFDRAEPPSFGEPLRAVVHAAAEKQSLRDMRAIVRELHTMANFLPLEIHRQLEAGLHDRFGVVLGAERHKQADAVARIKARGIIRSEREYRLVQAYADSIAADPPAQAEYLELGALLDAFSAAP